MNSVILQFSLIVLSSILIFGSCESLEICTALSCFSISICLMSRWFFWNILRKCWNKSKFSLLLKPSACNCLKSVYFDVVLFLPEWELHECQTGFSEWFPFGPRWVLPHKGPFRKTTFVLQHFGAQQVQLQTAPTQPLLKTTNIIFTLGLRTKSTTFVRVEIYVFQLDLYQMLQKMFICLHNTYLLINLLCRIWILYKRKSNKTQTTSLKKQKSISSIFKILMKTFWNKLLKYKNLLFKDENVLIEDK